MHPLRRLLLLRSLSVVTLALALGWSLGLAAGGREGTDVGIDLEARLRPEVRENRDFNSDLDDSESLILSRFRLGLSFTRDRLSAYVQAQDSRRFGEEASTASNEENLDLHQGYVQWRSGPGRFTLRLGRQELSYGEERLVGAFGWDNVGRSFDGALARWERAAYDLDAFVTRTADRGSASRNQDFLGIYAATRKAHPASQVDIYGFYLRDGRNQAGEILAAGTDQTRIATLGARLHGKAAAWSYMVELARQTGDAATDDHSAWALASRLQYTFHAPRKPSLAVGYDAASGDGDPADGDSEEFLNLFPTNHAFYGYMDYAGWRNIEDLYVRFGLQVTPRIALQADLHHLRLQDPAGRWSNAGGATVLDGLPGGGAGDDLGRELDLTLKFAHGEFQLMAGLSAFFAGEVPEDAFAAGGTTGGAPTSLRGDDSVWGYVMATFRF